MSTHEELRERIQQAIIQGSVCWENLDSTSGFDSGKANQVAADLYDYVVEFIAGLTNEKAA